jgi:hypothetical protein
LATALIICIEALVVRNFFVNWAHLVELTRNYLFVLGFIVLIGGELVHRFRAKRDVLKLIDSVKKNKK